MNQTMIGLDIGSSAVRAVELRRGRTLRLVTAGQVALAPGAVDEGEVVDPDAVGEAVRRLWDEAGFSSRQVVLGVSGQRVIVRQAELPSMPEGELRSSLRFQAQDLIPIPIDESILDVAVLDPGSGGPDTPRMRVLLAAASRETVEGYLSAAQQAGLDVAAVEPASLAMLRPATRPDGPELPAGPGAVVSVGASLTTVALRHGGAPAFVRVLADGGARITARLAGSAGTELALAEAHKRSGAAAALLAPPASTDLDAAIDALVGEIGTSLEFFLNQTGESQLDRVFLTGGGALLDGFAERLSETLGTTCLLADPFEGMDLAGATLDQESLARLRPFAGAAVGLAERGISPAGRRINLLPAEVHAARRRRKLITVAAASAAGVVVLLGGVSAVRLHEVSQARSQLRAAQAQAAAEQAKVSSLGWVTTYVKAAKAREATVAKAGSGLVDWTRVVSDMAAAMPSAGHLTTLTATKPAPTAAGAAGSGAGYGTLTMGVEASGGEEFVAQWLRALGQIHYLTNIYVASATTKAGTVTFSCTASLTQKAPTVSHTTGGGK